MSEPVRVVHLIPSLERAGAENALTRVVTHSDPAQVRHTVVSLTGRGPLAEPIEAAGVEVIALGARSPASTLLRLPRLLSVIRAARPEVVQGWMVHANLLAWLARALAAPSARLAWNLRGSAGQLEYERPLTRLLTRAAATVSKSVDLLIANSAAGFAQHAALGYRPKIGEVLPNGFDLDTFRPDAGTRNRIRDELGLPTDAIAFGLIGRFHPVKGHTVFAEAAGTVAPTAPNATFVLVGAGTQDSQELEALLAEHQVTHRFLRLGVRADVADIMRALDVVCVPSFYEGFPNVVGEAMACAIPCIATEVSDVRTILGDGGLVIPIGDAEALADAMTTLAADTAGREAMGRAGRQRAEETYCIRTITSRYTNLYRSQLTGNDDVPLPHPTN
ncbi:glycosyltransferase [Caulobacter sp. 17J65-9]|uniref:glycosyltransferase n=1 Tax=Caulobacter sp. 17J65-9 TaxID=2709382 RepID=UPI0013CD2613|nr:glycosyltransferase [Caulobacter sp. 17J65-9]NEX92347.1 glycosyltransferase [Caulobacter sp. 17J65-9]